MSSNLRISASTFVPRSQTAADNAARAQVTPLPTLTQSPAPAPTPTPTPTPTPASTPSLAASNPWNKHAHDTKILPTPKPALATQPPPQPWSQLAQDTKSCSPAANGAPAAAAAAAPSSLSASSAPDTKSAVKTPPPPSQQMPGAPAPLVRNELPLTFSAPAAITVFSAAFIDEPSSSASASSTSSASGEKEVAHLARLARRAILPAALRAGVWSSTKLYVPRLVEPDGMLVVATPSGTSLSLVRERVLDTKTDEVPWLLLANESLRRALRDEPNLRRDCITFPEEAKRVVDAEQNLQLEILPAVALSVRTRVVPGKSAAAHSVQVGLRYLITDPRSVGELLQAKVVTAASILETKRVINRSDDRAFVVDAVDLQHSLATVQKGAVLAQCRKALETRDPQKWAQIQSVADKPGLIVSHYKHDEKKQPLYLSAYHCALPGAPTLTSNHAIRRQVMSHIDNTPARLWACMQFARKKLLDHPCMQAWGWNLALPTPASSGATLLAPPKILVNDKAGTVAESLAADWTLPRRVATCKPFQTQRQGKGPRTPCLLVFAARDRRDINPVADALAKALALSSLVLKLVPMRDPYDDAEWKAVWPADQKSAPFVVFVNANGPSTSASAAADYAWFKAECGRRGCLSQVINLATARRLSRDSAKLASYAGNLAIQIQAKLGMPLWKVPLPAGSMTSTIQGTSVCTTMVVGVDVCHEAARAGVEQRPVPSPKTRVAADAPCDAPGELHEGPGSTAVVGVVASLDAEMTQWTEVTAFQKPGHDRVAHMAHIAHRLLATFAAKHGRPPAHVLIFRDGLSREQTSVWTKLELAGWQHAIGGSGVNVSMLVCTKRTSVRLMELSAGSAEPRISRVGHAMFHDDEYPGFDLVTTAHPNRAMLARATRYCIVRNDVGWSRAEWLEFVARRAVGYMNWRGAVSLPDVLMYAHRVAYLGGRDTSIPDPRDRLSAYQSLFFL